MEQDYTYEYTLPGSLMVFWEKKEDRWLMTIIPPYIYTREVSSLVVSFTVSFYNEVFMNLKGISYAPSPSILQNVYEKVVVPQYKSKLLEYLTETLHPVIESVSSSWKFPVRELEFEGEVDPEDLFESVIDEARNPANVGKVKAGFHIKEGIIYPTHYDVYQQFYIYVTVAGIMKVPDDESVLSEWIENVVKHAGRSFAAEFHSMFSISFQNQLSQDMEKYEKEVEREIRESVEAEVRISDGNLTLGDVHTELAYVKTDGTTLRISPRAKVVCEFPHHIGQAFIELMSESKGDPKKVLQHLRSSFAFVSDVVKGKEFLPYVVEYINSLVE
ncbi:MAG: hypothetical protein QW815_00375 [Nitrososphaerota archaeon]